MKLEQLLNTSKLAAYIANGTVDQRFHSSLPLSILCYSKRATYDGIWDDVTEICRGLIFETYTGEVVARPFSKFFSLNHAGRPETDLLTVLKEPSMPVFSEKLDGSMGTFWKYGGQFGVATKGSFHSEQAEWATQWLKDTWSKKALTPLSSATLAWPVGYTPVFEIIAQSVQHHVVHYLPHEDNRLVLTALVNNETGAEMEPEQLITWASVNGVPVVDTWRDLSIYEATQIDREGREGYIATWYRNGAPPLKVKIKHATFLKLQKIAHHTTPKTIFESLREPDPSYSGLIDEALQFGSPFLQDQVKAWVSAYKDEYKRLSNLARTAVEQSLKTNTTRKEHAAYFLGMYPEVAAVCFAILDEKDYKSVIWDLVEPIVKTIKFEEVEAE